MSGGYCVKRELITNSLGAHWEKITIMKKAKGDRVTFDCNNCRYGNYSASYPACKACMDGISEGKGTFSRWRAIDADAKKKKLTRAELESLVGKTMDDMGLTENCEQEGIE